MKTEISRLHNTIGLIGKDWLASNSEMMNNLYRSEEASARGDAALIVISLFFAGLLVVAFTSNPIASGTQPGERAPIFTSKAYNGDGWETFVFDDLLTPGWSPNSTGDAPWIAVEFMDTDCGHCKTAAEKVGNWAEQYSSSVWDGPEVIFIAVSVEFVGDSSRSEIEDFRDSNEHTFVYVDDLDLDVVGKWDVGATPTYFLVQPDGLVAWNSGQAVNSIGWDADKEEVFSLIDYTNDNYIELNEAIEQLTKKYGGGTQ